jgi:hypothetical protein
MIIKFDNLYFFGNPPFWTTTTTKELKKLYKFHVDQEKAQKFTKYNPNGLIALQKKFEVLNDS